MGAYELGDCPAPPARFVRGDANGEGSIDIADPIFILTYLFVGGRAPDCLDAADVNDDGTADISDPVRLLGCLFLGAEEPPPPFGACGGDPTADDLSCNLSGGCP
jgi:hypothetical protein